MLPTDIPAEKLKPKLLKFVGNILVLEPSTCTLIMNHLYNLISFSLFEMYRKCPIFLAGLFGHCKIILIDTNIPDNGS